MKTDFSHLEAYRGRGKRQMATRTGDLFGAFQIPFRGCWLRIICAPPNCIMDEDELKQTEGWEHVSVHKLRGNETKMIPSWEDMCYVKNLFFEQDETVIQIHPPKSDYVNTHEFTLHLWRHPAFKLPPKDLV